MKIILALCILCFLASIIVGTLAFISQDWITFIACMLNMVAMGANSFLFYSRIKND